MRDDEIWGGMPAVGDWVVVCDAPGDRFAIEALLPRRTKVSRKTPWLKAEEHILVANVDTVLLVNGLDEDFNPRRLERYLTAAWDSGADPVIVLTKLDVLRRSREARRGGERRRRRTRLRGEQRHRRRHRRHPSAAATGLGRSSSSADPGTGKSTLVNRLAGKTVMDTGELRNDGRGRHRLGTVSSSSCPAARFSSTRPDSASSRSGKAILDSAFADIADLAAECKFNDRAHSTEPDCAVQRGAGIR